MSAYPRKQTVFIFIICALITGGTAFYVYGESGTQQGNSIDSNKPSVSVEQNSTSTIVSNADWQKQFLNQASTTSAYTAKNVANAASASENLSTSDKLGRDFLTKYAQLKQSGLVNDPQAVSNMVGQVATNSINDLPSPKNYSAKDLKITVNTSSLVRAYGNAILLGFEKYTPTRNEAEITNQAFDDGDMSELSQIDPVIDLYGKMVSYLLNIPVPSGLENDHLDLVNGYSIAYYNAQSLRHIDTDPVKGLAAVALEMAAIKKINIAFSNMQSYFISAGVPFGS